MATETQPLCPVCQSRIAETLRGLEFWAKVELTYTDRDGSLKTEIGRYKRADVLFAHFSIGDRRLCVRVESIRLLTML